MQQAKIFTRDDIDGLFSGKADAFKNRVYALVCKFHPSWDNLIIRVIISDHSGAYSGTLVALIESFAAEYGGIYLFENDKIYGAPHAYAQRLRFLLEDWLPNVLRNELSAPLYPSPESMQVIRDKFEADAIE